jgi:hypothetical protein
MDDDYLKDSTSAVVFTGENWKTWLRSIRAHLMRYGMYAIAVGEDPCPEPVTAGQYDALSNKTEYVQTEESLAAQRDWIARDRKAYGCIADRIDQVIFGTLPEDITEVARFAPRNTVIDGQVVRTGQSYAILEALQSEYSAAKGERLFERLRALFRTSIPRCTDRIGMHFCPFQPDLSSTPGCLGDPPCRDE